MRAKEHFGGDESASAFKRWGLDVGRFLPTAANAQHPTPNSEKTMRRYSQRQGLTSLSEINITPLLDLAFVLLIIFMITTPLLENSVNLVIPSSGAPNPPLNANQVQTISIDRAETIKLNNQLVNTETLTANLIELKRSNPDVAVVIRPDRDLPVQKLVTLMDALQRAEISKVGIATKSE